MKDDLVTSAFPSESEFQEWCEGHGGEFEDSDYSMTCTLEDDEITMSVGAHDGPHIANKDSEMGLHPMTTTQKVFVDRDQIIVKERNLRGHLGEYIKFTS